MLKLSLRILTICLMLTCLFNFPGMVWAASNPGGDFTLTDQDNRDFELQQLRGKVVLMFFGYTSCPDVCPMELGKIARVLANFEKHTDQVKGIFISVDPDRDHPEKLKEYTAFFSKQLLGLTGSRKQIDQVVKQYHANYKITDTAQNRRVVDHSSNLYVIDKEGELDTIIPFGMGASHIITIVESLLEKKEVAVLPE